MSTPKVVLVTGSSSGFGRLTVETLARQGYSVWAGIRESATRNKGVSAELQALAEKEGLDLNVVELDVLSEASVEGAVQLIVKRTGRLDVVVNNAGVGSLGPLEAYSAEQVQQLFDSNVFSIIRVNRAALPHMRQQNAGLLIQVSSVVGRQAFPVTGLYAATKFAVEALTEAYRHELAALGIDALVVEPGAYPTGILSSAMLAADSERIPPYASLMEQVGGFLQSSMHGQNAQVVADSIASLIATPAGQRPLRTVVAPEGGREGIEALNGLSEQVYRATVDALGWSAITAFKQP